MFELEKKVKVINKVGLHARPAATFVKESNKFNSEILVEKAGEIANAKSIIGILSLGIEQNCIITIKAKGKDARIALNSLVELIKNGIGETE